MHIDMDSSIIHWQRLMKRILAKFPVLYIDKDLSIAFLYKFLCWNTDLHQFNLENDIIRSTEYESILRSCTRTVELILKHIVNTVNITGMSVLH